ncbi:MAG: NAD(P)/FAD-dependent oxidoreductase, partial [Thermoleophilia bacterium]|nr:NAD(P)/FAD-dependent oxidoreductase [Thermoleophilia bacterium]
GFSGLGTAVKFKQHGRSDFVLFEQADDVGGTWRDNTYPGIACDVPSNLYSFSFALNPNWSNSYSPGGEIWDYLRDVARRFDILRHVRFNHQIKRAEWNDDAQHWRLQTSEGEYTADVVISALGPLSVPMIPDLPGIDSFKGETFHSQQWDHDFDFEGKRVAVVGTGASAIQFVPRIQPEVSELHLYQRTPPWVLPRSDRKISRFEHLLFKYVPFTQKLVRAMVYALLEIRVIGFIQAQWVMRPVERLARAHIRRQVRDPELRKKLTPDYKIGCKRILLANDYYSSLTQPNVELIASGVREVRERSVVGSDGTEREVDAIVWGTGFHVTTNPAWDHLIGRDGRSLGETWGDGGLRAYKGTLVENFPNMFFMMGPNTGLGHNSMVYMIESNIDLVDEVIRFIDRSRAGSVEISKQALDIWNERIQREGHDTVWTTGGCASWYLDAHGRNTTLWPSFTFKYRQACHDFDPTELIVRDSDGALMLPRSVSAAVA